MKDTKYKRHYYTNGKREIRLNDSDPVPPGYYRGRVKYPNSTKGLIRITDGIHEHLIDKNELIPEGWHKGRPVKFKQICSKTGKSQRYTTWINNGIIEKKVSDSNIPEGFVCGRLPMTYDQKQKCSMSHKGKTHTLESRRKISMHSNNNRTKAYETIKKKYGSLENYFSKIIAKTNASKHNNHTFNTSKAEGMYYDYLCDKYGKSDVLRDHKTDKYPYRCDFYIISEDLYIELNYHWTHGEHPYDEGDTEDQIVLSHWKEKAKTSQFYKQAIDTWTRRDVLKLKTLRENKLKFKIIYSNEIIDK